MFEEGNSRKMVTVYYMEKKIEKELWEDNTPELAQTKHDALE